MHVDQVGATLEKIDRKFIQEASQWIIESIFKGGNALYLCGNGGSHAIVSHFATDLHKTALSGNFTPRIFALGTNLSLITALSNDFSFEEVFSREVKNLGRKGDTLFSVSSSGVSPNIIAAMKMARNIGMVNITLNGFADSDSVSLAEFSLDLKLVDKKYELAEDIHSIVCHSIAMEIKKLVS